MKTPITPGLKSFAIAGPMPVNPIKTVMMPDKMTPSAKLPPNTSSGIPCAEVVATSVKKMPHHNPDCPSRIGLLCPKSAWAKHANPVTMNDNCKIGTISDRSEEHTSELQSRFDIVCRLLLEKKHK